MQRFRAGNASVTLASIDLSLVNGGFSLNGTLI